MDFDKRKIIYIGVRVLRRRGGQILAPEALLLLRV
jgi:hypothetical protein